MDQHCVTLSRCVVAASAAVFLSTAAYAQDKYPSQPVRIIVPYSAGGGVDITARVLAESLRKTFGQTFLVENRPGASGMIGAQAVAKGSSLLVAGNF